MIRGSGGGNGDWSRPVEGCGGRDQGEAEHTVGMLYGDVLRDPPTHRDADEVRPRDAEGVEDAQRVGRQVRPGVRRLTERTARGPAGVAVVVADHEPAGGGDLLAELRLPPVHRRGCPADEQDGGVIDATERVDAELRVADRDHRLGHVRPAQYQPAPCLYDQAAQAEP